MKPLQFAVIWVGTTVVWVVIVAIWGGITMIAVPTTMTRDAIAVVET